jgi:hypothetical protein
MTCRSLLIAESLSALYTTMRRCLCSTCVCVCVLVYMHILGTDKLCTGICGMCGA